MVRLFLIRHGQPSQVWGGTDPDPGLSDTGHQQAERAAVDLAERGQLGVVTSPMRRCQETAAPFAKFTGRPALIEPRVSEVISEPGVVDRGAWLQARFPWRDPNASMTWASLEPELHQWRRQMLDCVLALQSDTAVFSHFIAINVMVGAALQREETIVCRPDHASITELRINDGELKLVAAGVTMRVDDVR